MSNKRRIQAVPAGADIEECFNCGVPLPDWDQPARPCCPLCDELRQLLVSDIERLMKILDGFYAVIEMSPDRLRLMAENLRKAQAGVEERMQAAGRTRGADGRWTPA